MKNTERKNVIDKYNIWKRFFNKLTTGFAAVISFVFQNPFSSEAWVVQNSEKQSSFTERKEYDSYHFNKEPKKSDIELNLGHQLLTYQAMQIHIRVTENEPPVGYLKVLQCLRRQPAQMN